jgi:O-antigen/teichoic acid export membrane protein
LKSDGDRSLARGFVLSAAGSAALAVASLVRTVVIARVMGPAAFGLWRVAAVALRLGVESHAGALSVLAAEAPVHRGAGRHDAARDLESRASTLTTALALAAGVVAALVLAASGGRAVFVAAAVLGATAVLQQRFFADAAVLKSRNEFGRVALAQCAFAALHLGGLVWLVPARHLTGALVSWAAALVVAVIVMRVRPLAPLPLARPSLEGRDLVRRGAAPWLVTVAATLLLQADQVVVGAMLGTAALGLYGVLAIGAAALSFAPEAFGGALAPVAGLTYGRAGEDPSALARLAERSVRGLALASAAVLALSLAGTDVVIAWQLPGYAAATTALRPYLAGVYLLALGVPLRFLLVTTGRSASALRAQVVALVAAVALEAAACAAGWGLVGVACAGAIVACALLAALLGAAARAGVVASRTALRLFAEATVLLVAALVLDMALAESAWQMRVGVPLVLAGAAGWHLLRTARAERAE